MGKGSFLIAGYNTASKEEKEKYDIKKLCHVVGGGFGIITVITGIELFYEFKLSSGIQWLMPWGILIVIGNTYCKKR